MKIIDYKKQALDQFFKENQNKFIWLCFNEICYIRVKVLEIGNSNDFENTLVKVVKTPKWIKDVAFGTFVSGKGIRGNEWNTVKNGTKIWTHFSTLYKTPNIMKYIHEKKLELMGNVIASKKSLEVAQKSLDILKEVQLAFEKAPDYPKDKK